MYRYARVSAVSSLENKEISMDDIVLIIVPILIHLAERERGLPPINMAILPYRWVSGTAIKLTYFNPS